MGLDAKLSQVAKLTGDQRAALESLRKRLDMRLPVGAVIIWGTTTAPAGFVKADGALYDGTKEDYARLWDAYGTTHGGAGVSSFAVPNIAAPAANCCYVVKL